MDADICSSTPFSALLLRTQRRIAPRSTALEVLSTAKLLPYNVQQSLCGPQDRYRHHFDPISRYSAGRSGPQDRSPSPARRKVTS